MEKITPMITRNPEFEESVHGGPVFPHGARQLSHPIQRLSKKNAGENSQQSTSCAFSKKLMPVPRLDRWAPCFAVRASIRLI